MFSFPLLIVPKEGEKMDIKGVNEYNNHIILASFNNLFSNLYIGLKKNHKNDEYENEDFFEDESDLFETSKWIKLTNVLTECYQEEKE